MLAGEHIEFFKKAFRFLIYGLPAFLLALPLNYLLVDLCGWPKSAAYAFVLVVQVSLNFVMCRLFVFERTTDRSLLSQYLQFMGGILGFRVLDWGLYLLLVEYTSIHYLIIQTANVFIFSVGKFLFAKRLFEKKREVNTEEILPADGSSGETR